MRRSLAIIAALLLGGAAHAETWHIDSRRGDDRNSGKSPADAWKSLARLQQERLHPGDEVMLGAGSVWREQLLITDSGSAGAPIIVARFGSGAMPRIEAGGVAENAVEIRNAEYVELSGIEITNTAPEPAPRRGVFVNAVDFGVVNQIVLRDLYIHDVAGSNASKDNGGIIFSAIGKKVPTRFEGMTIERNILWKVDRSGIAGISDQVNVARWFPSRFVIIRDNVLEDIGGDGIVPRGTDGTLIEHNIVRKAASRAGDYNVAIWQWSTDNTLIQLNEAAFTHGLLDGQGFDSDFNSRNTTFLYNFSHDNDGGFLLICTPVARDPAENIGNTGTLARNNVSVGDHERIFQLAGASDAIVERNIVHTRPDEAVQMVVATWWNGWSQNIDIRDNWLGVGGAATYGYETGRSGGRYIIAPGFPPPLVVRLNGNVFAGEHGAQAVESRAEKAWRPELWAAPILDPARPDDLPEFLKRHRQWMLDMLAREFGERPVLEQPKLMMPGDYRRK